jgi:hypothetical protein
VAMNLGELFITLGVKDKGAIDAIERLGGKLEKLNSKALKAAAGLGAALGGAMAAAGAASIKLAMNAVESENLFEVSMGKMSGAARAWSQELQRSLGLNAYNVRKTVGTFDVMLKSMGQSEAAAFDMSKGLTQLAYDMASFYNLSPEVAFEKLQSGISGEIEPLKQLGIIVSEDAVKAYALSTGMIKAGQSLSDAGKVAARYGLIMQSTALAQGDLARTIDSPTNKLRILKERVIGVATDLGMKLLPAFDSLLTAAGPLAAKLEQLASNGTFERWGKVAAEGVKTLLEKVEALGAWVSANGDAILTWGRNLAIAWLFTNAVIGISNLVSSLAVLKGALLGISAAVAANPVALALLAAAGVGIAGGMALSKKLGWTGKEKPTEGLGKTLGSLAGGGNAALDKLLPTGATAAQAAALLKSAGIPLTATTGGGAAGAAAVKAKGQTAAELQAAADKAREEYANLMGLKLAGGMARDKARRGSMGGWTPEQARLERTAQNAEDLRAALMASIMPGLLDEKGARGSMGAWNPKQADADKAAALAETLKQYKQAAEKANKIERERQELLREQKKQAWKDLGAMVTSRIPGFKAAQSGAQAGAALGPWGAAGGAILGLALESKALGGFFDSLQKVIGPVIDTIGVLLAPALQLLFPVVKGVATVIMAVWWAFGKLQNGLIDLIRIVTFGAVNLSKYKIDTTKIEQSMAELGKAQLDLTDKTKDAAAAMKNVPQVFKAALVRSDVSTAATGSSSRGLGAAGDVHVHLEEAQIFGVRDVTRMVQTAAAEGSRARGMAMYGTPFAGAVSR